MVDFCLSLNCSALWLRCGDATLVIVDLPSGREFVVVPEDETSPPGTKNADNADASVPREIYVSREMAVVVSLERFVAIGIVGARKRGIGASVFIANELSVINKIFLHSCDIIIICR